MDIIETENMSATITLKSNSGTDVVVAYLSVNNLNSSTLVFSGITCNVTNKQLIATSGATNIAGETAAQQYSDFETAVKTKAKSLGYTIFA